MMSPLESIDSTVLKACLKTVVSAILADVAPGFQPGGKSSAKVKVSMEFEPRRP